MQRVAPNYFDVMGIDIQRGSSFEANEHTQHRHQVIIDRHLADKMWPKGDAIGKRINIWGKDSDRPLLTVIGIVEDVKHQSVMGDNIPNIYISLFAYPHTDAHYVVQSSSSLADLEPELTNAILALDENQPTFEYTYMSDIVDMDNWQAKVSSTLFLTLAGIGSIIAGVGLFSMMAFILLLKIKELALRRVLGITDQGVILLVLKDMLSIAGVGILGGILLSPILLRPLTPFLFEVGVIDIPVYSMVIVALFMVSILATFMSFRGALTVNPSEVLRGD